MKCKSCGARLELTMTSCPSCGAEAELGRLTGILGIVCRACDSYNEPGARTCAACGKPLGSVRAPAPPAAPAPTTPAASPSPAPATPAPATPAPATLAPATLAPATPAAPGPTAAAPGPAAPTLAAPAVRAPAIPATPPAPSTVRAATAPPAAGADRLAPTAPQPGGPVLRSFQRPAPGAATRFVPSVLRPSPASRPPAAQPGPIALVPVCPQCGAATGAGRFCAQCGQALGAHGTQVMEKRAPSGPGTGDPSRPLAPGGATLVLEAGGGEGVATFRLNAASVEAGRAKGDVVFPDDPCLAPHHATFVFRDGALLVRDERGPGGVYLRLRGLPVPLAAGDHFALGERLFRYAGPLPPAPTPPPDGTRRLGAPRPPSPAIVIEEWLEGGAAGRVFVRGGPSVTIGRGGCAVSLGDDPTLSQSHAEVLVDAQGMARLRDLGSSNGTFVRIPAGAERELRDGDRLRMGREVLRVSVADR